MLIISMSNKGLVTNYREEGYTTGGGGHVKFYPYKKGAKKVLAMLKGGGGHKRFMGSLYAVG